MTSGQCRCSSEKCNYQVTHAWRHVRYTSLKRPTSHNTTHDSLLQQYLTRTRTVKLTSLITTTDPGSAPAFVLSRAYVCARARATKPGPSHCSPCKRASAQARTYCTGRADAHALHCSVLAHLAATRTGALPGAARATWRSVSRPGEMCTPLCEAACELSISQRAKHLSPLANHGSKLRAPQGHDGATSSTRHPWTATLALRAIRTALKADAAARRAPGARRCRR